MDEWQMYRKQGRIQGVGVILGEGLLISWEILDTFGIPYLP